MDRGALKWPSDPIMHVIVCLWKNFKPIKQQPQLLQDLFEGQHIKT